MAARRRTALLGPPAILDAYEAERQPITEQVSRYAMNHAVEPAKLRSAVPAEIDDPGPAGTATRMRVGRELYDLNVRQYCCGGLNFGYFYDASPIIEYDDASPPGYGMYDFTPSTVPGCRTPHLWLRDGRSLYDALGPDYTLIRTDPSAQANALLAAAAQRRVPITMLDLDAPEAAVAPHRLARRHADRGEPAFENAMAQVGCPDRRIDRLCIRWHKPHIGSCNRLTDGLCVGRIVLLPFDVRLDVGRWH